MVSRRERMRLKCTEYLEMDFRENLKCSQLLFENPFLGVLVTNDEQVFAFGADEHDYFGLGPATEIPKLTKIDSLCGKKIHQFAAYGNHILALSEGGVVYAWGCNDNGQLGNNSTTNSSAPIVVAGDLENKMVEQIECGFNFSVARTDKGEVFTWGRNAHGRTGHGTSTGRTLSPRIVEGLLGNVIIVKIACNHLLVLCLSQEGKVYGFGANGGGYLGIMNTQHQHSPVLTMIPDGHIVLDISSGYAHTLALTDMGVLLVWGFNGQGQLGTGSTTDCNTPTQIKLDCNGKDSGEVTLIHTESTTSFAMDDKENVYVWGSVNGGDISRPTKKNIDFPEPLYKPCTTQSNPGSVVRDLLKSFDTDATSDFVITVDGKDIHVHKTILQLRSPYFRTMFNNDWKETDSGKVVIEYYSYDVYFQFLRYLYCGGVGDLDPEQCMRLMDLATMALDNELAKLCSKRIKKRITVNNLLKVFSTALLLEKEELVDYCVTHFDLKGINEVIKSTSFKEVPSEHAVEFIHRCMLNGAFEAK